MTLGDKLFDRKGEVKTGLGGLEGLCTYHQKVASATSARCGIGLAGSAMRQTDRLDEM